jgi:HEAT repeat protein
MSEETDKIAPLIDSLRLPDKKAIRQAADELISLAHRAPRLVERLNALLREWPEERQWPVAYILAHLPSPSSLSLRVLTEALGSGDPDIRWASVVLLVRLGKNDPAILKRLTGLLKSASSTQRRMAVYCLRDLDAEESRQALLDSLQDGDPLVRVAAVTSLKARPEIAAKGAARLLHLLRSDPDLRVRSSAVLALARLDEPNDEIRAALNEASRSENLQLKKAANAALELLKKKGPVPSGK